MDKSLKLYNTFTKSLKNVTLSGVQVSADSISPQPIHGSLYICGPTVYSDSHLGHALTYIRADLLRRVLKAVFNVRLFTVMNITDIDDKILHKTSHEVDLSNYSQDQLRNPSSHPFNQISEKYYASFLRDMSLIRVLPADLNVRVSSHVNLISAFIGKLEQLGHAYVTPKGDVNFRVRSVNNYVGRTDNRREAKDHLKDDQRDFALWKAAKPDEPVWQYSSSLDWGRTIPGRPGWHVQCSAIASSLFGSSLDIHYGGKDLIFPHHYNEQACSCAFHQLDTTKSIHVWAQHWLHSGHLTLKDEKVSKSLNNTIEIGDFVKSTSINALRLLCVQTHYRSDLDYSTELLDRVKDVDHKIGAFASYLNDKLKAAQEDIGTDCDHISDVRSNSEVEKAIKTAHDSILDGICNDMHLDQGLDALLSLSKLCYSTQMEPLDLVNCLSLIRDWSNMCGLSYASIDESMLSQKVADILVDFRQQVRQWTLDELKSGSRQPLDKLLQLCDQTRNEMGALGIVLRDPKLAKR